MKKSYFAFFALVISWQMNSQTLNQNAGWPNMAWTVTGNYNTSPFAFEADPRISANFAFDDDDSGSGYDDDVQAVSPVIDLTAAHNAMEMNIKVSIMYIYRPYSNDVIYIEYWNADTANWVVWGPNFSPNTTTATDNYCNYSKTLFSTPLLDITNFTPTQLSGFKYRINYNDNPNGIGWNYGFCVASPTITSVGSITPDLATLQSPGNASFFYGQSVTVYGQVFKAGLTDTAPNISGQAPGIEAWIGYSATDTNPNTWTNWIPATWDATFEGNNDQYKAELGSGLMPGTYYYATRFSLNSGPFVYGGLNGSWNATTNPSGALIVNFNDNCQEAIPLTAGGVFEDHPINGTVLPATTGTNTPSCQSSYTSDVWYTVQIPPSGRITVETRLADTNTMTDGILAFYTGDCMSNLTQIDCNDDGGPSGPNDYMPLHTLAGLTPGITLYIQMAKYGAAPDNNVNAFKISAYDYTLGSDTFSKQEFSAYPNPVKDLLYITNTENLKDITIINLMGQQVMTSALIGSAPINISGLSAGSYLVKMTTGANEIKTMKIIKQ